MPTRSNPLPVHPNSFVITCVIAHACRLTSAKQCDPTAPTLVWSWTKSGHANNIANVVNAPKRASPAFDVAVAKLISASIKAVG